MDSTLLLWPYSHCTSHKPLDVMRAERDLLQTKPDTYFGLYCNRDFRLTNNKRLLHNHCGGRGFPSHVLVYATAFRWERASYVLVWTGNCLWRIECPWDSMKDVVNTENTQNQWNWALLIFCSGDSAMPMASYRWLFYQKLQFVSGI